MSRYASPERASLRRPTLPNLESSTSMKTTKTTPSNLRFNFFSNPPKTQTVKLPSSDDDELLTLDIHTALYPHGVPTDNDPFSQTTFKSLLANAEALLTRLQTEYRLRTVSMQSLMSSATETQDVLEEASTRAICLRSQLEELSHGMSMKDQKIAELEAQLSAEKFAREKSISLVREQNRRNRGSRSDLSIDTTSEVAEDLGISTARKWRRSQLSATSTAGTEADSDVESESIFSRSLSPTRTMQSSSASVAGTIDSTPEIGQAVLGRVVQNPQASTSTRPKIAPHRNSLFQKMLGSISPEKQEKDPYENIGMGEEGCTNCMGKDASVAWDTVGLLRAENRGLKERVTTLEEGVEEALGLCLVMV